MKRQQALWKWICLFSLLGAPACERSAPAPAGPAANVVARFKGGTVTREELLRESQRLPPNLRARFEQGTGREEFIRAMVDKRLLALEAERRGLTQDSEIRRQVRELEERLTIQAMLAQEEKTVGAPSDAEARAHYQANLERFAQPERLRMARILVSVSPGSPRAARTEARQRADALRRRIIAGEPVAKVAAAGEGPERTRGGELGLLSRGEFGSAALEKAAWALTRQGEVTPVIDDSAGAVILVLLERQAPRVPPFEEVREAVLGQMAPMAQRRVFEQVLARLRAEASVELPEQGASPSAGADTVSQH
ncbi:peptidyl-prolyl cis-trans isomerase [Myxococcus sp. AM009]|uniref:peptidylprolyl isomerase n=1 Tax=Myxococcus sp. AM009 TaxID=2745137 RepID=UPI0015961AC1|nr:peptidylprolyl isomerase [Myxococcus sp. AM009]NVI98765.1 peptidyl-prolyl cis-trans isomerase [Myxococcus sp. AM009]